MIIDSIEFNSQDIFFIAILLTCVLLCFEYDRIKNQNTNVKFTKDDPVKNMKIIGTILGVVLGLYLLVLIMVIAKKGFKITSPIYNVIVGLLMFILAVAFIYAFLAFWLTFADNYYNRDLFPYLLFIGLGLVAVIYLVGNKIGYGIPIEDGTSVQEIKQGVENSKKPNIARKRTLKASIPNSSLRALAPQQ